MCPEITSELIYGFRHNKYLEYFNSYSKFTIGVVENNDEFCSYGINLYEVDTPLTIGNMQDMINKNMQNPEFQKYKQCIDKLATLYDTVAFWHIVLVGEYEYNAYIDDDEYKLEYCNCKKELNSESECKFDITNHTPECDYVVRKQKELDMINELSEIMKK